MAIRIPNLGTGNGQTGDNEFKIRSDYNNNFSDRDNAASRQVGEVLGDVMGVGAFGLGNTSGGAWLTDLEENLDKTTFFRYGRDTANAPNHWNGMGINLQYTGENFLRIWGQTVGTSIPDLYLQLHNTEGWQARSKIYHDNNTTTDGNGYIKPSSPVLRVFNDRIEGNADGDTMGATYTKNGVGDYTITGTTGLRTDGWYITVPNDINGNPKVAVTLDDTDGVITLKTYARIFDMTTFKFVPDLEQPLDIPDGRWIDLRFNDLPIDDVPLPDEV